MIQCCLYPQHQIHSFMVHSFSGEGERGGPWPLRDYRIMGEKEDQTQHKEAIRAGDGGMAGVCAMGWRLGRQEAGLQTFIL